MTVAINRVDVRPDSIMDLQDVARAVGWTPGSAQTIHARAVQRRREGTAKPTDLPEPLRVVAGRHPIWRRSDIEDWLARRNRECKQCGRPVASRLPAGSRLECARCAGLEGEE